MYTKPGTLKLVNPFVPTSSSSKIRAILLVCDGILPSQDHVHEEVIPSRPRTRSRTKRLALLLEEDEVGINGFTSFKVLSFVYMIS